MSSLFIIGNGFDLAHGMPTKYSDFRDFILYYYPKAKVNRDLPIDLDDYLFMEDDDMSAELLVYAMDHAIGETWSAFEEALHRINFNEKIPKRIHLENETEEEDHEGAKGYLLYVQPLISLFIDSTELWGNFFQAWITAVEYAIDNKIYSPRETIKSLIKTDSFRFFSFNYTGTLEKLYGIKKVVHIHNRVGEKLIFGHGEDESMYNGEIMASFLDDMIQSFKKDTDKQIKKNKRFFQKLNDSVNKVYSYGFSYSSVDMVYIKNIISRISKDSIWYFTEFEAKNTEELQRRKNILRENGFEGDFDIYEG